MLKKIDVSSLKVGMFVCEVHSSWLNSPLVTRNFKVKTSRDVARLREYGVRFVSIDTDRGAGLSGVQAVTSEEPAITFDSTFDVCLDDLRLNRPVPVDLYIIHNRSVNHVFEKNLALGAEVYEMFVGRGMSGFRAPLDQKPDFEKYRGALEKEVEKRMGCGYDGPFIDPEQERRYLDFLARYHPVSAVSLVPDVRLDFGIYARLNGLVTIVVEEHSVLGTEIRERWIEENTNLLIRKEDKEAYHEYLMEHTRHSRDIIARAAYVREESKLIVESISENPRSEKLVNKIRGSVSDVIQVVIENPSAFYGLMKLNSYDYYTFTHSVNVATMTVALSMAVNVTDSRELGELGLGAILHDIGKSKVDKAIIGKPGRLTPEEFSKAAAHVTLGYEMIRDNPAIPDTSFIPLLQHHEKLSGSGYPNGLAGEQIHLFGRIAAIIDIYDALTTQRAYRKALAPYEALNFLFKCAGELDQSLLALFVKLLREQTV